MGLYPTYLQAGYSPQSFWDNGLDEIQDLLEAFRQRLDRENNIEQNRERTMAVLLYNQALQISNMVGVLLGASKKVTPFETYYPWARAEEPEEGERGMTPELEAYKLRMQMRAEAWNETRKKKGGMNGGSCDAGAEVQGVDGRPAERAPEDQGLSSVPG